MSNCEKYQELISCLIDGELSPEQSADLENHIAHCPECREMYRDFSAVSGMVSSTLAEVPEGLHENIMAGVRAAAKPKRKPKIVHLQRYIGVAACLVVVIGAVFALQNGGMMSMKSANSASNATSTPASAPAEKAQDSLFMAPMDDAAPADDRAMEPEVPMEQPDMPSEECAPADEAPEANEPVDGSDYLEAVNGVQVDFDMQSTIIITVAYMRMANDTRPPSYGNAQYSVAALPEETPEYFSGGASECHATDPTLFSVFCGALKDGISAGDAAKIFAESFKNREYPDGTPEKMAIIEVNDSYLVAIYGAQLHLDGFIAALEELYTCNILIYDNIE